MIEEQLYKDSWQFMREWAEGLERSIPGFRFRETEEGNSSLKVSNLTLNARKAPNPHKHYNRVNTLY